jgi:hypothetical protein
MRESGIQKNEVDTKSLRVWEIYAYPWVTAFAATAPVPPRRVSVLGPSDEEATSDHFPYRSKRRAWRQSRSGAGLGAARCGESPTELADHQPGTLLENRQAFLCRSAHFAWRAPGIEFNPSRSINCQARSIALFLSLMKRSKL